MSQRAFTVCSTFLTHGQSGEPMSHGLQLAGEMGDTSDLYRSLEIPRNIECNNAKCCIYSPVAIIRNTKIWNIILLVAFFRTLSSNLDLEYPAVSEENCLKNPLPLPLPLISWEFRHF